MVKTFSMEDGTKKRLFELMKKMGPNFKVSETEDRSEEKTISGDVENANRLRTSAEMNALSKVNTQREFNDAFETWFDTLGVSGKYKDNINITTSISHITNVMKKKGIKF